MSEAENLTRESRSSFLPSGDPPQLAEILGREPSPSETRLLLPLLLPPPDSACNLLTTTESLIPEISNPARQKDVPEPLDPTRELERLLATCLPSPSAQTSASLIDSSQILTTPWSDGAILIHAGEELQDHAAVSPNPVILGLGCTGAQPGSPDPTGEALGAASLHLACCGALRLSHGAELIGSLSQPGRRMMAVPGLVEHPDHATRQWFRDEGDCVLLLGDVTGESKNGFSQETAHDLGDVVRALIIGGTVKSARHCFEGGLAIAIARCCLSPGPEPVRTAVMGVEVDLTPALPESMLGSALFGRNSGWVVVTCSQVQSGKLVAQAGILGVGAAVIGRIGGESFNLRAGSDLVSIPIERLNEISANGRRLLVSQ